MQFHDNAPIDKTIASARRFIIAEEEKKIQTASRYHLTSERRHADARRFLMSFGAWAALDRNDLLEHFITPNVACVTQGLIFSQCIN
jgi:hypothetical protein